MKFILFNVMVVVAILYLVSVDEKPRELPRTVFGVKTEAALKSLAERSREKLNDFKLKKNTKTPSSAKEVVPEIKENTAVSRPVLKKAPAMPAETEVALRAMKKVPENNGNAKLDEPKPTSLLPVKGERMKSALEKPKYMTPKERRSELNRLVYEMEMMFADKLTK